MDCVIVLDPRVQLPLQCFFARYTHTHTHSPQTRRSVQISERQHVASIRRRIKPTWEVKNKRVAT